MNHQPVHGTVVALRCSGQWRGVLLRGPSGSGKSDTALRLMAMGARLVVDDRALLWANSGRLYARSPATIRGLIEIRGPGILPVHSLDVAAVHLVVDAATSQPERMQDQSFVQIKGLRLPRLELYLPHAGTPSAISAALESL